MGNSITYPNELNKIDTNNYMYQYEYEDIYKKTIMNVEFFNFLVNKYNIDKTKINYEESNDMIIFKDDFEQFNFLISKEIIIDDPNLTEIIVTNFHFIRKINCSNSNLKKIVLLSSFKSNNFETILKNSAPEEYSAMKKKLEKSFRANIQNDLQINVSNCRNLESLTLHSPGLQSITGLTDCKKILKNLNIKNDGWEYRHLPTVQEINLSGFSELKYFAWYSKTNYKYATSSARTSPRASAPFRRPCNVLGLKDCINLETFIFGQGTEELDISAFANNLKDLRIYNIQFVSGPKSIIKKIIGLDKLNENRLELLNLKGFGINNSILQPILKYRFKNLKELYLSRTILKINLSILKKLEIINIPATGAILEEYNNKIKNKIDTQFKIPDINEINNSIDSLDYQIQIINDRLVYRNNIINFIESKLNPNVEYEGNPFFPFEQDYEFLNNDIKFYEENFEKLEWYEPELEHQNEWKNIILEELENTKKLKEEKELEKAKLSYDFKKYEIELKENTLKLLDFYNLQKLKKIKYINISECRQNSIDLSNKRKLVSLYCGENRFSKLNLSKVRRTLKLINCARMGNENFTEIKGISKCKNLVDIEIYKNRISKLDINNLRKLKYLDCANNNLKQLDVSNNLELTNLFCEFNNLKKLDVSNNKKLLNLYCKANGLEKLDVRNNKKLLKLDCTNNKLNKLDVSNNKELVRLQCGQNKLNELDISNNKNIVRLFCTFNKLEELDLTNNTKLYWVKASSNPLKKLIGLENLKNLFEFHTNDTLLTKLIIKNCINLENVFTKNCQLEEIIFIGYHPKMDCIKISNNKLKTIDLKGCPNLTGLYIANNKLNNLDLSNNLEINTLDLENNPDLSCITVTQEQSKKFNTSTDFWLKNKKHCIKSTNNRNINENPNTPISSLFLMAGLGFTLYKKIKK